MATKVDTPLKKETEEAKPNFDLKNRKIPGQTEILVEEKKKPFNQKVESSNFSANHR